MDKSKLFLIMLEVPQSWEDVDKRISQKLKNEAFQTWADRTPKYRKRNFRLNPRKNNVIRVLTKPEGKDFIKQFDYTHNIVTNDGEIFYAKMGAGETPAAEEDFSQSDAVFELGTTAYSEAETDTFNEFDVSGTSKISGSRKAYTSTYPKTNDTGDADNTGDAVDAVSYAVSYTTGDFNDTDIEQGTIHDDVTPITTTKLLSVYSFTSFAKTASDTLKVFVNHAMESV